MSGGASATTMPERIAAIRAERGAAGAVHGRLIALIEERIALERAYAVANACPYLPPVEAPADHGELVDRLNANNRAILDECLRLGGTA